MGVTEAGIIEQIVKETQSELILFFIILAVFLIIIMIPLFTLVLKDRKHKNQLENERLQQYIDRESRIIQVITANTEVMTGLKTTLERDVLTTSTSLSRIHDRIDDTNRIIITQGETLARISTTLDEAVRNQATIKNDIKQILYSEGDE